MAAYNRNRLGLMGPLALEDDNDDVSMDFSPLSLQTGTAIKDEAERERQKKELKAKEKKIRSKMERHRLKQEAKLEQQRQALEGSVSSQLDFYESAKKEFNQSHDKLDASNSLLDASDSLFKELNQVTDPSNMSLSSMDDESFASQIDAIKAKKDTAKQKDRDAFLAAKKKKEDRKLKKKEKENKSVTKDEKGAKKKEEESKSTTTKIAAEKSEKNNIKVDAKANFIKAEKEHKEKLRQKKEEEKAKRKAEKDAKALEKERKLVQKMAAQIDSIDGTSEHRRAGLFGKRLSKGSGRGLGLFRLDSFKKTKQDSFRTRNGIKPRTDVTALWGIESTAKK